jgi:carboxypeptidase Taq
VHYKKLKEIFIPQFDNMNLDEFMKIVNDTKASLIRVDADELTYVLHIMIRYDLEKQLINGNLEVEDLPTAWNEKTKEYLGITPMDLKTGVLQDIHWSYGSFGYFPTYALGSAYSAQIYNSMNKEISIIDSIKNNEIYKINEWLKNKIHKYGKTKTPKEIIKLATGEDFDPNYYIDYLKKKYE